MLSLLFVSSQITIYLGISLLIGGVLGASMNIVVFLSLKTFRQNPCAFYLTIMSIVNIGQLFLGLSSRVMIAGFGIDWTVMSLSFCKFRWAFFQFCILMSYTCLCLATIDQYFVTCTRRRWQKWSNIKIAHRLILIFSILWSLHMIPYLVFMNHVTSPVTGKITCTASNTIMGRYANYVIPLSLSSFVPDFVTILFGILAYRNVQQIAYRTVPLVRRELDKQLTVMVLVQVVLNFFTNVPCVVMNAVLYSITNIIDPVTLERLQFCYSITVILFYIYFAVSKNQLDQIFVYEMFFRAHSTSTYVYRKDFVDNLSMYCLRGILIDDDNKKECFLIRLIRLHRNKCYSDMARVLYFIS
jgi:hypothetical protein